MKQASGGAAPPVDLRWGIERRLEFIEFRLYWEGRVNRADLTRVFGISIVQASADLARYQALAPDNLVYDKRAKTYLAAPGFAPLLLRREAEDLFAHLKLGDAWASTAPPLATMPVPARAAPPETLRVLFQAVCRRSDIEMEYQSMTRAAPRRRRIMPHAFGNDGRRWHVRAWCYEENDFRDFVLGRILELRLGGRSLIDPADDVAWLETVTVVVAPHPGLSPDQRRAIEIDYAMTDGTASLEVRKAMLFYVLAHLQLLDDAGDPGARQITLVNKEIRALVAR
jgi:predicted DNA-binding transcriptional regulator YafY